MAAARRDHPPVPELEELEPPPVSPVAKPSQLVGGNGRQPWYFEWHGEQNGVAGLSDAQYAEPG